MIQGDAVKWANEYEGELHHALLTDCPYHLSSIVKRFGGKYAAPAQEGTDGAFRRMSAGFMGMEWDGVSEDGDGVSMKAETWAAFSKVLYPGAFLLVCAGCLNDDAISMAMREAGLIKHHSLHYCFGSGFPKATRIPDDRFAGHRYGRQSLKPSTETILLFQKPYSGRPVDNITKSGAGALNIDAARIRGTAGIRKEDKPRHGGVFAGSQTRPYIEEAIAAGVPSRPTYETASGGRWPSNLLLDESGAEMLDRQSGKSKSGTAVNRNRDNAELSSTEGWGFRKPHADVGFGDSGGSSRFFFCVQSQLDDADPLFYTAKAGRVERDSGLDGFALRDGSKMSGGEETRPDRMERGLTNHPMMRNPHPTLKPLSLTRYLASLLLPPIDYAPRRIFLPFAGVGSECIGAELAGWEVVSGVEQDATYCEIGRARRRFWKCNSGLFEELTRTENSEQEQGSLF